MRTILHSAGPQAPRFNPPSDEMDTVSERNHANALAAPVTTGQAPGSPIEVLRIFLKLGIAGLWLCRGAPPAAVGHILLPVSRTTGLVALTVFFVLLVGLPLLSSLGIAPGLAVLDAFYCSGALVFGGGHVVLPLLREAFVTPGWVSDNTFLAGYGAAQAVPGPLFTFAAFLGTVIGPSPHGIAGAVIGLTSIFLPGILVLLGMLPFWDAFRNRAGAQAMMRGVNAAVVGLLGAALYNPVWTTSVKTAGDFGIALVGFVLLMVWRIPPLFVVLICALGGALLLTIGSHG